MDIPEAFVEIKELLDGQNEYNLTDKQIEALEVALKSLSALELLSMASGEAK
jgi:hypothetical protein